MTSLFDNLKEGLEEVIAFAKGEGPARVTRSEIESAVPNKQHWYVTDYYDRHVIEQIIDKYGMDPMDATRSFLTSETHRILEDAECGLWMYPERAVFDMWETEQRTGEPRNSVYIRGE